VPVEAHFSVLNWPELLAQVRANLHVALQALMAPVLVNSCAAKQVPQAAWAAPPLAAQSHVVHGTQQVFPYSSPHAAAADLPCLLAGVRPEPQLWLERRQ